MKTRMSYLTTAFVLAVILALLFAAYPADSLSQLANQQPRNAAAAGPLPINNAVAISIPASDSSATTHTVTGLYNEPDSSSEVAEWLMPGTSVRLLGRSADGAYFAIAYGELSEKVGGWIAAKDLDVESSDTHVVAMAMVFQQPGSGDDFTNMLTYGQAITVLGTSPDGSWTAVARKDSDHSLIGWVLTSDLQTEAR